jgi:hypothetical protein
MSNVLRYKIFIIINGLFFTKKEFFLNSMASEWLAIEISWNFEKFLARVKILTMINKWLTQKISIFAENDHLGFNLRLMIGYYIKLIIFFYQN